VASYAISATASIVASQSIVAGRGLSQKSPHLGRIWLFHVANDGLPAIVHMDMLDADDLLAAVTQAPKRAAAKQAAREAAEQAERNALLS
jgi:hypothetical protein